MQHMNSAMSRLVRFGKRSFLAALFAAVLTSSAVPATTFASQPAHFTHPNDGVGDSPLVP